MEKHLTFKWTVSKASETYGYTIVSLWIDGRKVSTCSGGGYDMEGTCFGEWIQASFLSYLQKLKPNYGSMDKAKGFYGLSIWRNGRAVRAYKKGDKVSLDGACGFSSMERILGAIGYKTQLVCNERRHRTYLVANK